MSLRGQPQTLWVHYFYLFIYFFNLSTSLEFLTIPSYIYIYNASFIYVHSYFKALTFLFASKHPIYVNGFPINVFVFSAGSVYIHTTALPLSRKTPGF